MKLNIDFQEIVDAYEDSSVSNIYHIDTKKSEIIYYNDALCEPVTVIEKIDSCSDDNRYIYIPPRLPQDEFFIMEKFVYEKIQNIKIAEKFHRVLEGKKPFKNFKDLLFDYPDLQEKWFTYHREYLKNETINWLSNNNIELSNQCLIPDIEIRKLTKDEINNIPDEIKDFGPVRCMNCNNDKGFTKELFITNVPPENKLIEQETEHIMKEKFNIAHYGWWNGENLNILTVSRCPKCKSEHIIWDY